MNVARTISTIAIWLCTAVIFLGGVFRYNWNGILPGFLWALVAVILAITPALATRAVWNSDSKKDAVDAARDDPTAS